MMPKNLLAVIDVGSNQITMKIAQKRADEIKILETLRGALALGDDTYAFGEINDDSIRETCAILGRFKIKLAEYGIEPCRVVATSAIREALNRDYVLNRVYQNCGFRVEIMDDSTEYGARLVAMAESLASLKEAILPDALVVNIGAGSVHISYFCNGSMRGSESALLGALRVSGILQQLRIKSARPDIAFNQYLDAELNKLRLGFSDEKGVISTLIVLGEETKYLKKIARLKRDNATMDIAQLMAIQRELEISNDRDLTLQHGIPPLSCRLLLPAAALIAKIIERYGTVNLYMPDADLCQGLLYEYAHTQYHYKLVENLDDVALSQAAHFAENCGCDAAHITETEHAALKLFDGLKKKFGLTERQRLFLRLAARLLHVGAFIKHSRHGEVSFGMIRNFELIGLSEKERERVAWMAAFGCGDAIPLRSAMPSMPGVFRQEIISLTAILRIAEALDESGAQALKLERVRLHDDQLILHCRAEGSSELETFALEEAGKLFQEAYGLDLRLTIEEG